MGCYPSKSAIDLEILEWDEIPDGKKYVYNIVYFSQEEVCEYAIHKCSTKEEANSMVEFLNKTKTPIYFKGKRVTRDFRKEIVVTSKVMNDLRAKKS